MPSLAKRARAFEAKRAAPAGAPAPTPAEVHHGLQRGLSNAYVAAAIITLAIGGVGYLRNTTPDATQRIALQKWLRAHGAIAPKLRIGSSPIGGLGTFATGDIASGEAILSVPKKLMITGEKAPKELTRHAAIAELLESSNELSNILPVMLALLAEADKGNSSFYAPYIATLPTAVDNPLAYSKEQRAELDGTLAAPLLKNNAQLVKSSAAAAVKACADGPPRPPGRDCKSVYGEARMMWALVTVRSRGVLRDLGDGNKAGPRLAMVPLLDILNHEVPPAELHAADDVAKPLKGGGLTLNAARRFAKGDEVVWTYGAKPNYGLLLEGGFALPPGENPYEQAHVVLRAVRDISTDPLFDKRQKLLDAVTELYQDWMLGRPPRMVFCMPGDPQLGGPTVIDGWIPVQTLVRARVLVLRDSSEIEPLLEAGPARRLLKGKALAQSARERDALKMLIDLASRKLGTYPNGAALAADDPDEAALEADANGTAPLERPMRMILRTRLGEKRVLRGALEAMRARESKSCPHSERCDLS